MRDKGPLTPRTGLRRLKALDLRVFGLRENRLALLGLPSKFRHLSVFSLVFGGLRSTVCTTGNSIVRTGYGTAHEKDLPSMEAAPSKPTASRRQPLSGRSEDEDREHVKDRRDRLIERRRASRRGRPKGSTIPLLQHPHRFETAAWMVATLGFGIGPANAAAAVAGVFSTRPIRAEAVGELVMRLGGGIDHATLKGRADSIRRRAEAAVRERTDMDEAWMVGSCGALLNLLQSDGDAGRMSVPLMELRELGWGPTLARISARINAAAQASNFPPAEGEIPRQAVRLAEALALKSKPYE